MNTYTALIKARVGSHIKAVPTQIRATNASDARWLLQAVYGFHALVSAPMLVKHEMAEDFPKPPQSPEQARIQSLKQPRTALPQHLTPSEIDKSEARPLLPFKGFKAEFDLKSKGISPFIPYMLLIPKILFD